ncbi:MAG: TonB-dependent receptor [Alphaproteobacteria bacterium]|nr:TonB-dependent receptor [Alphaproteobacteria bacterium]
MFATYQPTEPRPRLAAGLAIMLVLTAPALSQTPTAQPPARLPEVVSTANRTYTPVEQVGNSITVVTGAEMERDQIRIVSDALRKVPGLAVSRSGGVGSITQVRIRGAESNQTKVLIDGIEVNDPSTGSEFDFANMLAADIDRIEVLRGPQSVLYGSDAVGGVINIITRRGGGPQRVAASVEGGSYGTGQVNASTAGGVAGDRFRYLFSATRFHTDGISAADRFRNRANKEEDAYDNATAFTKLGATPVEHLDVDLIGRFTHSHREGDDFVGGDGAIDAKEDSTVNQRFGRVQATVKLLDDRWVQRVGVSGGDTKSNNFSNGPQTGKFEGFRRKLDYQSDYTFSTDLAVDAAHTLTLGSDYMWDSAISRSSFSNFDKSLETQSLWGLYQVALADQFFFTGGARHDNGDLFEDSTTYRLTGAWKIFDTGAKLRGSYGTGVKNPTLFDLYGFTPTFRPNPALQPEFGRGWDIGVDKNFLDGCISIGASYFEQRIRDLITGAGNTSINLPGVSRTRGVELTGRVGLMHDLDLIGAYTFSSTRDPDGNELVRRPKHIASTTLAYRFLEDRGTATLGVVYNGATTDFAFDQNFNRSIVRLDAYTLVNLGAAYKVTDNVEVYGRIENLMNEHYEEAFTYGSLGRAGYGGMKVTF